MDLQNSNFNPYAGTLQARATRFPALMNKVYLWMALALVITALTSLIVVGQPALLNLIFSSKLSFYGIMLGELALVWYLSARLQSLSFSTAGLLFAAYSILNGLTLSCIFLVYDLGSIISTFLTTAGTFGAMAAVGIFIKKDLTSVGRFLMFAVFGLIIASVVNIFVESQGLQRYMSYAGVLIFAGLTAYDTQKIRNLLLSYDQADSESLYKIALMGSLVLYLDFVNLFLYLLRILGRRK